MGSIATGTVTAADAHIIRNGLRYRCSEARDRPMKAVIQLRLGIQCIVAVALAAAIAV
jgi:hypothetical protein